jgi:phosphoserine phosphatase
MNLHVFDMDGTLLEGTTASLQIAQHLGSTEADVFAASPWLTGIREVCADIRERGERSVVITMSPDFFARHLVDLGFDDVMASRFPALPFLEPLDPANILTPRDKVRIVENMREQYGISRSQCVAYGDSMSDGRGERRSPPH